MKNKIKKDIVRFYPLNHSGTIQKDFDYRIVELHDSMIYNRDFDNKDCEYISIIVDL